jgi:hypothetical protein
MSQKTLIIVPNRIVNFLIKSYQTNKKKYKTTTYYYSFDNKFTNFLMAHTSLVWNLDDWCQEDKRRGSRI